MSSDSGILTDVARDYPDYLRDESRRTGAAETLSFPKTEAELRAQLAALPAGRPVTLQGARTGITGGAVPGGGHVLNLSRMNRIVGMRTDTEQDGFFLSVQPGLLLSEVREALARREFDTAGWSEASLSALENFRAGPACCFPPDPTEATASIGGMVACNASGALSFRYGPTRRYVEAMRVVLADGAVLELKRGEQKARGRSFSLRDDSGRTIEGDLPSYTMPRVKSAAGYFVQDDMDLVDLFIGAEGTLGIISQIEVRLIPAPAAQWGIMAFFPGADSAIRFVKQVRCGSTGPVAMEYFDPGALSLLRKQRESNPAFKEIPELPEAWQASVYVEYHGAGEEQVENAVMAMSEVMVECGGDEAATWLASEDKEAVRLKDFRHAVPEAVNLLIDERRKTEPGLTKLGTDLAVPDEALDDVISLYGEGLARLGLEHVMFGHIGNNHVHVNIIPKDMAEYEKGKELYLEWARAVVKMGGTVSAEHGIGKLKTAMLREMYGEEGIEQMRAVRKVFDPEGRLNPGNLFV